MSADRTTTELDTHNPKGTTMMQTEQLYSVTETRIVGTTPTEMRWATGVNAIGAASAMTTALAAHGHDESDVPLELRLTPGMLRVIPLMSLTECFDADVSDFAFSGDDCKCRTCGHTRAAHMAHLAAWEAQA